MSSTTRTEDAQMTTLAADKLAWQCPRLAEVDLADVTLAGGAAFGDVDPNRPS